MGEQTEKMKKTPLCMALLAHVLARRGIPRKIPLNWFIPGL